MQPTMRTSIQSQPLAGQSATRLRARGAKALPELVPADELDAAHLAFKSAAIQEESTDFRARAEVHNETAKLTVYVLNAILFLIAFPVGFGMLIFNILGGENLRTTAHVMALTGMGSALSFSGAALPLIG